MLDVGCFSAHLVVVRDTPAHPVVSHKTRLRLDRCLDPDGALTREGVEQVVAAVRQARLVAEREDVRAVLPWATSVLRDAPNAPEVFAEVEDRAGLRLRVLAGEDEARFAYDAARHWHGPDPGPLLVLDIGGGTVEVAAGSGPEPDVVVSLPYGARSLTRRPVDPEVVRSAVVAAVGDVRDHRAVGCSKVFQQLARLAGARPQRDGPCVRRTLHLSDLRLWVPRLAAMPERKRAQLPGISRHRAGQCAAGALVAEALMTAVGHEEVDICPWSTREGLLLALTKAGDMTCQVA